eukprot:TRINITY_DN7857_c0_g1_i1.p1 TRINITY_DN7857_c0_g1~~TRINITY_DN7857_c0_g1_i1.p1  ORF type:complete len:558 (+),score=102.48 TRINITY_DN7857_c0_g1_i1:64-1737(+)
MGIQSLLQLLQPATVDIHIQSYAGKRVAIDGYGWLHKGAYACAQALAFGKKTEAHIKFCMKRIALLKHYKVEPVIVLDGRPLPSKASEEAQRRARRLEGRKRAMQLLRDGRKTEANKAFSACVDISGEIAYQLTVACRQAGVEVIVAPYEADAQMAYLANSGYVDAVITEDSDLLVYQTKRVIYKLTDTGAAQEIRLARIYQGAQLDGTINFSSWTPTMFRRMCILAGCDYLPSPARMGIKTAYRIVRHARSIHDICQTMAAQGYKLPEQYLQDFVKAENTFLHQTVWNPVDACLQPVTPWPADQDGSKHVYAGTLFDAETAAGIACGDINPHTLEPYSGATANSGSSGKLAGGEVETDPELIQRQKDYLAQFSKGLPQTRTMDQYVSTSRRTSSAKRSNSSKDTAPLPVSQRARQEFKQPRGQNAKAADGTRLASATKTSNANLTMTNVRSKYFGSKRSKQLKPQIDPDEPDDVSAKRSQPAATKGVIKQLNVYSRPAPKSKPRTSRTVISYRAASDTVAVPSLSTANVSTASLDSLDAMFSRRTNSTASDLMLET